MLDHALQFVLRQRLLVVLGGALALAAGVAAWRRLPIDAFPDVTNVQVMVLTNAPGLAPGEVERLITFPIEVEMSGLPDVQQVRSLSKSGLSQVVVIFEDHVDTYFARELVFQRLAAAREQLPEGIEPELGPISTGLGEIFQYALLAGHYCPSHPRVWAEEPGRCPDCGAALRRNDADLMDLRTLQDWVVAPQLRRLAGITEVNSFGGLVKQFHVVPDPDRLLKYDLSLRDILEALEANNANAPGGFIVKDWEQINLVSKGLLRDVADIERIVLKAEDGTPVYLGDLAEVKIGHQTRHGVVTRDGKGEVVIGMTIMLKDANSKIVVDRVRAAVPEIQKTLPPGVKVEPFYDRTSLIQACVNTVSSALLQGAGLVLVVLFLILWDLRAAVTVALTVPLAASAAFLLMGWQGVTANLMSLGGLAIAVGMVVDGGIVMTENIARHMRERAETGLSRAEIALDAAREVAAPMAFAILIIMVVFLPLFTLESLEGKMFKPLALTMCFAMVGALVAALTVVPALASLVVKRAAPAARGDLVTRLFERLYTPLLRLALRGRGITVAVAAAAMVGTFSLLPQLGTEFLPALDEGALAINVVRLPTAGAEGSALQCSAIERRLLAAIPEVTTVVSKTGRAEIAEDPMGPEQSDIFVMLKPQAEWTPGRTREGLLEAVRAELAAFPGMNAAFSQPIALRVNELISGIKSDLAVKIFGEDMAILQATAERIAPILTSIHGARDIKIEQISGFSELEVQMDRAAMARHKVNAADINLLIEAAVGGKVATTLFEGQRRFAVQVRYPASRRSDPEAIERLLVPSPAGYHVPLGDLARIREVQTPAQVSREDSSRRLVVECNVRGRDIGSFVEEAKAKLAAVEQGLPQGYRLTWGGQFENQERAMARLRVVVPVAILLILVLLLAALGSLKSAVLVLLALPFAVVGGILAIYVLGLNLSVSASIGFIALFGVAVEDGLVLVSFCDQLRRRGLAVREAVSEACRLRVRSIITTSLTTLLGLFPMLYAVGPGAELQKPLIAVIFGGLITQLVLVLTVLPVLYTLVNRDRPLPPQVAAEPV
ncbi:MAG TPA: CusA/CzcA family heavy metal efflux RND transporter [Planctomycetota bacterium]|nr:CusA/CzcA family heavy metal efflux RND transporter [Planctomycetota bacterium]HRR78917.1 CusA/CzcA family heavy metal efflux RND transporter [Planctomycetota bacterium]HRT92805.1 CusA/CzcA family heavy metal efflux RND transporter [Planctomycetota bacterium]